jgi:hypothetical protein
VSGVAAVVLGPKAMITLCPVGGGPQCSITGRAHTHLLSVAIAGLVTVGLLSIPHRIARRGYLLGAATVLSGIIILLTTSIAIPD